jgi:hypothetical protein
MMFGVKLTPGKRANGIRKFDRTGKGWGLVSVLLSLGKNV